MKLKQWVVSLVLGSILLAPAFARAESAQEAFAKAETLLAQGKFSAALASFASAARADRDNQEYMQHYAMLRRVVDLRSRLKTETAPQRWEQMARALRAFYVSERIYPELLKLDREIHARLNSAESATMLAETQLAMSQDADAAKTLSAVDSSKATAMTQSLLGIALARTGKADQAREIAGKIALPADAGPNIVYAVARLHAAAGDSEKAVALLKTCFETTLPSVLGDFKSHAKECPEFTPIASTPEFTQVLETKSKVPESKCSGGSSCAGCPMSGKCPKSQGKQ